MGWSTSQVQCPALPKGKKNRKEFINHEPVPAVPGQVWGEGAAKGERGKGKADRLTSETVGEEKVRLS